MAQPERSLSVYSGTEFLGRVIGVGKSWRAFDARGNAIGGEFTSFRAATAAVNVLPTCSCVPDCSERINNDG